MFTTVRKFWHFQNVLSLSHFEVWLGVIWMFRTNTLHPFGNTTIPEEVLGNLDLVSPLIDFKIGGTFVIRHLLRYGVPYFMVCGFIRKNVTYFVDLYIMRGHWGPTLTSITTGLDLNKIKKRLPMEVLFSNLATKLDPR